RALFTEEENHCRRLDINNYIPTIVSLYNLTDTLRKKGSYLGFIVVTVSRPELRYYLPLIRNTLTKGSRPIVKSIVRFDNTRAITIKLLGSDCLYVYRVVTKSVWITSGYIESSLVASDHALLKRID
ncbi:hypothetical protein N7445_004230, partial [Penicillium cf. griseofulvum]